MDLKGVVSDSNNVFESEKVTCKILVDFNFTFTSYAGLYALLPRGVLNGKVGTGMCGPDRVLFPPLRFTNGNLFIWKVV